MVQESIQILALIEIDIIGSARLRLLVLLFQKTKDGKKGEALWSVAVQNKGIRRSVLASRVRRPAA